MSQIDKDFLKSIIHADRTQRYKYGEANDYDNEPPKSQRWLTPAELARQKLKEIENGN